MLTDGQKEAETAKTSQAEKIGGVNVECANCHLEKRLKIAENDILELQRSNGNQGIVLAELRIEVKGLVASVSTLLEKVEALASIPSKRYENIVYGATALVLGAVAGRLL